jgi:hypothetical protein
MHAQTKHFALHNHHIRKKSENDTIQVHFIPSDKQQADIFTYLLSLHLILPTTNQSSASFMDLKPLNTAPGNPLTCTSYFGQ